MTAIRVLIADDRLIAGEGLHTILREYADIQVIGNAENGYHAGETTEDIYPNVILMDLRMQGQNEPASVAKIKPRRPEIAIVILTAHDENELTPGGQQSAFGGDITLPQGALNRLLSGTQALPMPRTRPYPKQALETRSRPMLSQRELEILKIVATGARNKEIAVQLSISQSTVKAHLDSIFNKLGVDSRTAAVSLASRCGLLAE